jgi:hypothetical protein
MLVKKLKSAKNYLLGLSTKAKILVAASTLLVITSTSLAVAISSNSDTSNSSNTVEISGNNNNNKQSTATSTKSGNDTADNKRNTTDQQSQPHNTKQTTTTSTQNNRLSGRSSSGTSKTSNQPVAPKPDYNLNDGWYFAIVFGAGPLNKCFPEPFTEANEAQCMGGEVEFTEIGIAKTEQTASNKADGKLAQKAAAARVELRRGAGVDAGLLTEAACSQYGLSCGRW